MLPHKILVLLSGCLVWTATAERCAAQTLPPEGDFTWRIPRRPDSRRPVRTDLQGRFTRSRDAMRNGDLKGISRELAGPDFVVEFKRWNPGESQLRLAEGLLYFATGRWKAVHEVGDELLDSARSDEVPPELRADVHQLLALTYFRMRILPLAQYHADEALKLTPDRAGASSLLALIHELAGGRYTKLASILRTQDRSEEAQLWQSQRPGIQPLVVVFCNATGSPCGGAVCVEATDARQPAHYRLVYRDDDEDSPPAIILDCGTTVPQAETLIKSMAGFDCRARVQVEALYFQRVGLDPLASGWARVWGKQEDALLQAHVEKPLRDAGAWEWETRGRYFPATGAKYEVAAYVNRQAADPDWRCDYPGPLEHMHFAIGSRTDRRYLASYRLVSESPASGARIYFIHRMEGDQTLILDVLTEPPSYEELRDLVLSWFDDTERQPPLDVTSLRFDDMETDKGPVRGADVAAYFNRQGLKLETENLAVDVLRDQDPVCRPAARATSEQNLLGLKSDFLAGGTLTLRLSRPARRVWFHRAGLPGGQNSGIHPNWRISALDPGGNELVSTGEGSQESAAPTEFCLEGSEISALQFRISGGPWYAFFDDLVFEF